MVDNRTRVAFVMRVQSVEMNSIYTFEKTNIHLVYVINVCTRISGTRISIDKRENNFQKLINCEILKRNFAKLSKQKKTEHKIR